MPAPRHSSAALPPRPQLQNLGEVALLERAELLENLESLGAAHVSPMPESMEHYGQNFGLIHYRTRLPGDYGGGTPDLGGAGGPGLCVPGWGAFGHSGPGQAQGAAGAAPAKERSALPSQPCRHPGGDPGGGHGPGELWEPPGGPEGTDRCAPGRAISHGVYGDHPPTGGLGGSPLPARGQPVPLLLGGASRRIPRRTALWTWTGLRRAWCM